MMHVEVICHVNSTVVVADCISPAWPNAPPNAACNLTLATEQELFRLSFHNESEHVSFAKGTSTFTARRDDDDNTAQEDWC